MMDGIVKEIVSLSEEFFETIDEEDSYIDNNHCYPMQYPIAQRLRDRVEAFVDFLYRDYADIFKKLLNEASYAVDEDENFYQPEHLTLDDFEAVGNYIILSLAQDYEYKGPLFKSIFENNIFEKEERLIF
jgi:hypothetical protein